MSSSIRNQFPQWNSLIVAISFATGLGISPAMAAGPTPSAELCREIKFSDLGDNALVAKTSAAAVVLQALGYKPESFRLTQGETADALRAGKIDVFLGADLRVPAGTEETKNQPKPKAKPDARPLENLSVNQAFPLGPPTEVASVPSDRADGAAGSEPKDTAETGKIQQDEMQKGFVSQARAGFSSDCPKLAKFIKNLTYPPDMIWFIETQVSEEFEEPFDAAVNWFAENPQQLAQWLDGVKAFNGENALEKVSNEFAF